MSDAVVIGRGGEDPVYRGRHCISQRRVTLELLVAHPGTKGKGGSLATHTLVGGSPAKGPTLGTCRSIESLKWALLKEAGHRIQEHPRIQGTVAETCPGTQKPREEPQDEGGDRASHSTSLALPFHPHNRTLGFPQMTDKETGSDGASHLPTRAAREAGPRQWLLGCLPTGKRPKTQVQEMQVQVKNPCGWRKATASEDP